MNVKRINASGTCITVFKCLKPILFIMKMLKRTNVVLIHNVYFYQNKNEIFLKKPNYVLRDTNVP